MRKISENVLFSILGVDWQLTGLQASQPHTGTHCLHIHVLSFIEKKKAHPGIQWDSMSTPTHTLAERKKNLRQRHTVTAHFLLICSAFPLPSLAAILRPTFLSASNVEIFCQHKDGPLTWPIVHLKSFGREAAAEQTLCALNAEAPFKGAASRLTITVGNKLEMGPN